MMLKVITVNKVTYGNPHNLKLGALGYELRSLSCAKQILIHTSDTTKPGNAINRVNALSCATKVIMEPTTNTPALNSKLYKGTPFFDT
jgi:hypothetical protein